MDRGRRVRGDSWDTDFTFVHLGGDIPSRNRQRTGIDWRDDQRQLGRADQAGVRPAEPSGIQYDPLPPFPDAHHSRAGEGAETLCGTGGRRGREHPRFQGLETVRTDWTPLPKAFQTRLYEMAFHDQDPSKLYCAPWWTRPGPAVTTICSSARGCAQKLEEYRKERAALRGGRAWRMENLRRGLPQRYRWGTIAYLMMNGPEPLEYRRSAVDYEHISTKQLRPIADAILPLWSRSSGSAAQLDLLDEAEVKRGAYGTTMAAHGPEGTGRQMTGRADVQMTIPKPAIKRAFSNLVRPSGIRNHRPPPCQGDALTS